MAIATHGTSSNYLQRAPSPSGLADVIDLILDKGLVIDAYVRVAVIGIELVTIDARIVIASVDTYLRFAQAVNRLDIGSTEGAQGLPDLMEGITSGAAKSKTSGVLEAAKEKLFGDDDDNDDEDDDKSRSRTRRSSSSGSRSSGSSSSGSRSRSRKSSS